MAKQDNLDKIKECFIRKHQNGLAQLTEQLFAIIPIPEEDQLELFISSCITSVIANVAKALTRSNDMPYVKKEYEELVADVTTQCFELIVETLEEKLPKLNRQVDLN